MKKSNILFLILIISMVITSFSADLFPVKQRGKWGFIDKTGNIVIKPVYKDATIFIDGLAMVKHRNNLVGYIDETGKDVIEAKFKGGAFFSEGKAMVMENRRKNAKYIYIDKSGNPICDKKFDDGGEFREGLAPVKIGNIWKYINDKGEFVLDNEGFGYQDAGIFSEGLAPVFAGKGNDMKSYTYYYIDKDGNEKIKLETGKYMAVSKFSEGLAAVMYNRRWGYINKNGEFLIPAKYDFAHDFHGSVAAVIDGNNWMFINKEGKQICDKKWGGSGWAPEFYGNYYKAISSKRQQASSMGHRLFGGAMPMFNQSIIVDIDYYKSVPYFSDDYAPMLLHVNTRKRQALYGFVDKTGKEVFKKKYDMVWPYHNGLAKVRVGKDKFGYIDISGKEVWKPQK